MLYVPADTPARFPKAVASGADAVIVDLEDSVKPVAKRGARGEVTRFLRSAEAARPGCQLWVRVDPDQLAEDLAAAVWPAAAGVVLAKSEPDNVRAAAAAVAELERRRGIAAGAVALQCLIETATGLAGAADIASCDRVVRLGLGEADLIAELGLRPDADGSQLAPYRAQVVMASAVASLVAPIGSTLTDLADRRRLKETSLRLLREGFRARSAIHPTQIATINRCFTPSPAELADAQRVVDLFQAAGSGATVGESDQFIDLAVVRAARETLSRAPASD